MEIAIREKRKVRWVKVHKSVISTLIKVNKATALPLSSDKDFDKWWDLYGKKTTKKQTLSYWKKHITKDLIPEIMDHTKKYIKAREEKCHRLDPIRYLRNEAYLDEIIEYKKPDKKIDIKEYKHDTTGMPRGKCKECGKKDTYLNKYELWKGSSCHGAKVLPFK